MRERNRSRLGGVYQIFNLASRKVYVGSATYIKRRFGVHRHMLKNNIHDNSYLQSAWNKYGESNFSFEILEIVDDHRDLEKREQFWINYTKCFNRSCGYNLRTKANNNNGLSYGAGKKLSAETIEKIRKSNIGKTRSIEVRTAQSIRQKGKVPLNATKAAAIVNRANSKWKHA